MHDKIYSLEIYGEFANPLYTKIFEISPVNVEINKILSNVDGLQFYEENENNLTIFKIIADDIQVLLRCADVNEIFVSNALNSFINALKRLVKAPFEKSTINDNYDYLEILVFNFIVDGIIIETDEEEMYKKIPKRKFEASAMKMSRGFSSFFSSFGSKK